MEASLLDAPPYWVVQWEMPSGNQALDGGSTLFKTLSTSSPVSGYASERAGGRDRLFWCSSCESDREQEAHFLINSANRANAGLWTSLTFDALLYSPPAP